MKPAIANIICGVTLTALGLWGYFATSAGTALIPVVAGVIFLSLAKPFFKEGKVLAHIIVLLTLLIAIGLIKPLIGAISDGDQMGILRVGLMLITSAWALVTYINSFIQARRNRV